MAAINIKELKELIKDLPDSTLVILSRDSEGNGFGPAMGVSTNYKYKDGDVGLDELTDKAKASGYSEEDVMKGGKKAFILWP